MIKLFLKMLLWATLFYASLGLAAVPTWEMIPKESSLTFTATQNNAPVKGQFTAFSSDIHFDPANLNESLVTIDVDMNSVTASYKDVASTLKTADWFDSEHFPHALFKSIKWVKTGDNQYDINGLLTIRDVKIPIVLHVKFEKITATYALAKGQTELKRTSFGIGKGDWSNTDQVQDNVSVEFTLVANRK